MIIMIIIIIMICIMYHIYYHDQHNHHDLHNYDHNRYHDHHNHQLYHNHRFVMELGPMGKPPTTMLQGEIFKKYQFFNVLEILIILLKCQTMSSFFPGMH